MIWLHMFKSLAHRVRRRHWPDFIEYDGYWLCRICQHGRPPALRLPFLRLSPNPLI